MTTSSHKARKSLNILNTFSDKLKLIDEIRKKPLREKPEKILRTEIIPSPEGQQKRLELIHTELGKSTDYLTGQKPIDDLSRFRGNIENYIGTSKVPTGIIGPIRVLGSAAAGDYYVPLATTEGALVASYNRGAKAASLCGGITSICLTEGVQRSPVFKFNDIAELGSFLIWLLPQEDKFKQITSENSNYAELFEMKINIEGNHLIVVFEFHTGDAAGQNMVTFCTDKICNYIIENAPVKPTHWFIESNYSGDKKATAIAYTNVRGKKVTAEVTLTPEIVSRELKTTVESMVAYWQASTIGVIQSGSIGAQGHYANGLAGIFIATGQDVACVTEAATGITRMETTKNNELYVSVTLPNLIVGTVGGGTSLPSQRECLEIMDCYGTGNARKFAEIIGATVLAGEISIAAALSAGHFSKAHKKLGRKE